MLYLGDPENEQEYALFEKEYFNLKGVIRNEKFNFIIYYYLLTIVSSIS